ncbi:hypothetical protein F5Y11DRAFT_349114 [Daldinia sp. FL1419]|nr:hypothetical protein F5Y11DRAFT_349114 [Daldinia sp. FL1419]
MPLLAKTISAAVALVVLQATAVLAAPASTAAASWRLDCGSPGTTALCSASNSGAHCDPVSGDLTIILAGTCGACKCMTWAIKGAVGIRVEEGKKKEKGEGGITMRCAI